MSYTREKIEEVYYRFKEVATHADLVQLLKDCIYAFRAYPGEPRCNVNWVISASPGEQTNFMCIATAAIDRRSTQCAVAAEPPRVDSLREVFISHRTTFGKLKTREVIRAICHFDSTSHMAGSWATLSKAQEWQKQLFATVAEDQLTAPGEDTHPVPKAKPSFTDGKLGTPYKERQFSKFEHQLSQQLADAIGVSFGTLAKGLKNIRFMYPSNVGKSVPIRNLFESNRFAFADISWPKPVIPAWIPFDGASGPPPEVGPLDLVTIRSASGLVYGSMLSQHVSWTNGQVTAYKLDKRSTAWLKHNANGRPSHVREDDMIEVRCADVGTFKLLARALNWGDIGQKGTITEYRIITK